jgi:hypothetical protein
MRIKFTYEYVKNYFEQNGCTLLEIEYINNNHPMSYICNCGNISKIRFSDFKYGQRCVKCARQKQIKTITFPFEKRKNDIEKDGLYEVISSEKEFKNCRSKITIKCKLCGNIFSKRVDHIRNWDGCIHSPTGYNSRFGVLNYRWIEDRQGQKEKRLFTKKCCTLIRMCLESLGKKKNNKTYLLLGYNDQDLKNHIINHANWPNVKDKKWHIDHIFPIQAFIDYNISDLKIINCLENLRPLLAKENMSKHAKYDKYTFKEWLKTKGIDINVN